MYARDVVPFAEARVDKKEGFMSLAQTMEDIFNHTSIQGHGNGISRSNYTISDLKRLFEETQPIVLSNISNTVHPINSVILPLHFTDSLKHKTSRFIEQPVLPGVVPAFAGARTSRMKVTEIISKSERYGHGFEIEGDFKNTPEGRARIQKILLTFSRLGNERMQDLAIQHLRLKDESDAYSGDLGMMSDASMYNEAVRRQVEHFGILNKDPKGMEKLTGYVKLRMMQCYGFEPTHMILPANKMQTLRSTGSSAFTDYYTAGPDGPKVLAGEKPYKACLGVDIIDAPVPLTNRDVSEPGQFTEDSVGRHVVLGDFVYLTREGGMEGRLEWEMFSASDNRFVTLTYSAALENSTRFVRRRKGESLDWKLNGMLGEDYLARAGYPRIVEGAGDEASPIAPADGFYLDAASLMAFKKPDTETPDPDLDPFLQYGYIHVLDGEAMLGNPDIVLRRYEVVDEPPVDHPDQEKRYYIDPEYLFRPIEHRERAHALAKAATEIAADAVNPALNADQIRDVKFFREISEWDRMVNLVIEKWIIERSPNELAPDDDRAAKVVMRSNAFKMYSRNYGAGAVVAAGGYAGGLDFAGTRAAILGLAQQLGIQVTSPPAEGSVYVHAAITDVRMEDFKSELKHLSTAAKAFADGTALVWPTIPGPPEALGDGLKQKLKWFTIVDLYTPCVRQADHVLHGADPWSESIDHLVMRNLSVYRMQDAIYVAAGNGGHDLGYTACSKETVAASYNANQSVWEVQWRAWLAIHIKDWDRVVNITNAIYNGVIQGCNAKFINFEMATKYSAGDFMLSSPRDPSLYSIAVPKKLNWSADDIYFHTSGRSPHAQPGAKEEFPGSAYVNDKFGWTEALQNNRHFHSEFKTAKIAPYCFLGTLRFKTTSGVITRPGSTHHGIYEMPGCGEIRDRGTTVIDTRETRP